MQSYYTATIWKDPIKLPTTCKKAKAVDWENVLNAAVIKVVDASYRKATLSGIFVLSPFTTFPIDTSGTGEIDVLCRWFDHRLVSSGLTFKVDFSKVQHITNYSGEVTSHIAKK